LTALLTSRAAQGLTQINTAANLEPHIPTGDMAALSGCIRWRQTLCLDRYNAGRAYLSAA
jgi:hypothetical protein